MKTCDKITPEEWQTMTTADLMKKYGLTHRSTVNKYAREKGIVRPKKLTTPRTALNKHGYHYSDITEDDWKTLSVSEISRKYGFRMASLYRYIKSHRIDVHHVNHIKSH